MPPSHYLIPLVAQFYYHNGLWHQQAPVTKLIGPWGIWLQSQISKFWTHFNDKYLKYFLWNCYQVNATIPHWSLVNIGAGNGLVPSGTITWASVDLDPCRHMMSQGHNELTHHSRSKMPTTMLDMIWKHFLRRKYQHFDKVSLNSSRPSNAYVRQ